MAAPVTHENLFELIARHPDQSAFHTITYYELEWEFHCSRLEKKRTPLTKWQAEQWLTKEEMLEICSEKIIANEDLEVFMEYRRWRVNENQKNLSPTQIEQASQVPISLIFDSI